MRHLIPALAGLAVLGSAPVALAQPQGPPPPVVVASGSATVKRAPDRAFVLLATESRDPQPAAAQQKNAEAMTAVRARLKQAGIADEALKTVAYNLREEIDYEKERRVSRGYVVSNTVEVRVDDVSRVGAVLDQVVQAGATSVSNIRFDLKNREAAEREALRNAVADARARAEAAAEGAGLRIVGIRRIEEGGARPAPPPMPFQRAGMAAMAAPETPIEAGEIEIHASVSLTAEVAPR